MCSPIASAVLDAVGRPDGKAAPDEWNVPTKTAAEGTSIARPIRLRECVDAVVRSGGGAVRVTEDAIGGATRARSPPPGCTPSRRAQAAAAYEELVAAGQIKREETTVVVLTSTGVKATPAVAKVIGEEI